MFLSWQLTFLFRSTLKLVADALNDFPLLIKGQIGQLLHLFIPGFSLCGLSGRGGSVFVIWFGLVLMLQSVREVLVNKHTKFELYRCLVCPTIEINTCSILLIFGQLEMPFTPQPEYLGTKVRGVL